MPAVASLSSFAAGTPIGSCGWMSGPSAPLFVKENSAVAVRLGYSHRREGCEMPVRSVERKLAAIFAADIAGYSRLMARDEVGTLARLKACRVIIDGLIAEHRGRIFNTAGDSVVADFASAVDAVQCAVAVQEAINLYNEKRA